MDVERRAKEAEYLLNNELLQEAFKAVETDYLEQWKSTKSNEAVRREKLWLAVQIVEKVKSALHSAVTDGRVAEANKRKL